MHSRLEIAACQVLQMGNMISMVIASISAAYIANSPARLKQA